MTDPLGQSQVIPYLSGLSAMGHQIWLMSCEKPERYATDKDLIRNLLTSNGITWVPIPYTSTPPVISTIGDIRRMRREALKCVQENNIDLLHCRSYISALSGMFVKQKTSKPWIFDMRGFWADERVDGNIWNLSNPLYRFIYNYFKRKEKQYLTDAAGVVSLTSNAAREINSWKGFENTQITVIPCCADLDHFQKDTSAAQAFRTELNISDNNFVLSYLGSVGTWYMLDEMLQFFKQLLQSRPNALFLFITGDKPETILNKALEMGIPASSIRVRKASRKEVPRIASLSDASVFFIKPVFSKKASSPTKMGELMSMGIPLVCNAGVGDVEEILLDGGNGVLVSEFNNESYNKAVRELEKVLHLDPASEKACAQKYYSLSNGVKAYNDLYNRIGQSL